MTQLPKRKQFFLRKTFVTKTPIFRLVFATRRERHLTADKFRFALTAHSLFLPHVVSVFAASNAILRLESPLCLQVELAEYLSNRIA